MYLKKGPRDPLLCVQWLGLCGHLVHGEKRLENYATPNH